MQISLYFTLICSQSNLFFLQISPLVLFFFAERSLSQNSVQVPRGQSKSRWRISIGPKAHMAAYKRPATVQVRGRSHRIHATSQTPQNFLSLFSYNQIHKTQKSSRTRRTIPQTLTVSRTKFNQIQARCSEIHHGSQRFITESSSPNHFPCNSSVNSPLKAANSTRSQREKSEKKKEKFQRI